MTLTVGVRQSKPGRDGRSVQGDPRNRRRGWRRFRFGRSSCRPDPEELEYGGLRLRTTASISGARIAVTVDVAFGDALEPGAEVIDYPCMLDLPVPRLRAYARETVIAEKFQAMVALGREQPNEGLL